jgi:hypothetical protein
MSINSISLKDEMKQQNQTPNAQRSTLNLEEALSWALDVGRFLSAKR